MLAKCDTMLWSLKYWSGNVVFSIQKLWPFSLKKMCNYQWSAGHVSYVMGLEDGMVGTAPTVPIISKTNETVPIFCILCI